MHTHRQPATVALLMHVEVSEYYEHVEYCEHFANVFVKK